MAEGNKNINTCGWCFPIEADIYGGIKAANYVRSIEDSIKLILSIAPGELIVEPSFGCKINEVVFMPNNPSSTAVAEYYITEALNKWEPRIVLTSVKGVVDPEDQYTMNIEIKYNIPALNLANETSYDVNLEGGAK